MSYILDALTKLDQDRQRARAPDLYPPHETRGAAHRHPSRWLYLFGGALLAVIVMALSFHFWNKAQVNEPHSKTQEAPEKREARIERGLETATPAGSARREKLPLTLDQVRARELPPPVERTRARPVERTRARPVELTPRPPVEQSPPRPVAHTSAPPVEQELSPTQPVAQELSSARREPAERNPPKVASETTPPAVMTGTSRPPVRARVNARDAKAEAAEATPKKMSLTRAQQNAAGRDELPASVQAEIPKISLSGFAYSDDPKARVAFVNGQMLAEGDEVGGGVRVEQILRDGVAFSYKGHRFRRGGPGSAN